MKSIHNKKGFTLVEIMVVVSIIAFISSIVSFNLVQAKAKAQDTSRVASVQQLRTAVTAYKLDHDGVAPPLPNGVSVPINDSDPAFATTLAPLITGKYISKLPSNLGIFYFNNSAQQTVIGTTLTTGQSSITGASGTCRPFTAQVNVEPPSLGTYTCVLGNHAVNPGTPGVMTCTVCTEWGYCHEIENVFYTQCNNSEDDDEDGLWNYPEDPGCASYDDNGESPDGPVAPPYCSNTLNSDYCMCM